MNNRGPGDLASAGVRHAAAVGDVLPRQLELATTAVNLATALLEFLRHYRFKEEANTLAAWMGLRRATEQLRVALMAAMMGNYSEVALLARAAYESAGLARMLAHEPKDAEKWIRKGVWHPDRRVRQWVGDQMGTEGDELGREVYGNFSNSAHTTWASVTAFLPEVEDPDAFVGSNPFDEVVAEGCFLGIASTGLFVLHCLRNAVADETVLPVELRQAIVRLHEDMGGEADHLHRDWEEEERRRNALMEGVADADTLDERLRNDPRSLSNLRSAGSPDPPTG